jgi:hypothetical protein
VHDTFTFEQIVQMWRLARALPKHKGKLIASAITAAAIRLHQPLVPRWLLVVRVPWLPGDHHMRILSILRAAIKDSCLHPIIADFYSQNIRIVTVMWPSVSRLLVDVFAKRKRLHRHGVDCTCKPFVLLMKVMYGWDVPMLDGHVFFAGCDYAGPHAQLLKNLSLANIPVPDAYAIAHRFGSVCDEFFEMLGVSMPEFTLPATILTACDASNRLGCASGIPLRPVMYLKWLLSPLICTPLDRNLRMCLLSCPRLYNACALLLFDPAVVLQYERRYALPYKPGCSSQSPVGWCCCSCCSPYCIYLPATCPSF